jgi:hypothetical protein
MASLRRQILETFKARLSVITKENGFLTDSGKLIFLGATQTLTDAERGYAGAGEAETALSLGIGPDDVGEHLSIGDGGADDHIPIQLTVQVAAIAGADLSNPIIALENVIHDIKKAVELQDRTLSGLVAGMFRGSTQPFDREEGSTIVGATVSYGLLYSEVWGDPEANS